MKINKYIFKTLLILGFLGATISCSDEFLDQPAIGAYDESVLSNPTGVSTLLTGIYAQLNGTNSGFSGMLSTPWSGMLGSIRGGEALVGTEAADGASWEYFPAWKMTATTSFITGVFPYYYNAISMCNQLLALLPNVTGMTDAQKTKTIAETRFLRAHFYFIIKRIYGNIPWVDETNVYNVKVPNTDASGNYVDIWPKIEADMQFAIDNLPPTQLEKARVNSWAAKAYMVKILMTQKKYDVTTYNLLMDVVTNGVNSSGVQYGLMPFYHDNFDPDKENNKEGVFVVQISVNATSSGQANLANPENQWAGTQRPGSPGNGRGWGYYQPSQWFVDHFRVNASGLPYLDYYATEPASVKSDYGLLSSQPFTIETKPVDPRLDWIVGRRGIPFLDWGLNPGTDWLRDATGRYSGPYTQKKWVYSKAKEGVHNQTNSVYNAIDGPVIRFADVLLWAAEMEVRVKHNLVAATGYVNQIRARMQNSAGWVKNAAGTASAANYNIGLYPTFTSDDQALTAILHERTLELGLEGHRFYDIIRFGDVYIQKELQDYATFQGQFTPYMNGAVFEVGVDELAPLGQTAIINSQVNGVPTLTQNPGY